MISLPRSPRARRQNVLPIGAEFGRIRIIGAPFTRGKGRKTRLFYPCHCECGREKPIRADHLKKGLQSCGCGRIEAVVAACTTHGETRTRLRNTWSNVIQRCHNPKNPRHADYGGRGIQVCQLWRYDYTAFRDWAMANGYRDSLEIERIDNDGPYAPCNCRWATRREQTRNTRQNRFYSAFGETKCLKDWSDDPRCKASLGGLTWRLRGGWDFVAALTTPPAPANKRRRKMTPLRST